MFISLEEWQFPIGRYRAKRTFSDTEIHTAIATLKRFPSDLKKALEQCTTNDLDQGYRPGGWTIRQLVHHIADSHMHSYMRCKYAYLEETPTIKGYEEKNWAEKSPDALSFDIEASVKILEGVHERWTYFFEQLNQEEWLREYSHPERTENFPLAEVAYFYAWHAEHHLNHILNYLKFKA